MHDLSCWFLVSTRRVFLQLLCDRLVLGQPGKQRVLAVQPREVRERDGHLGVREVRCWVLPRIDARCIELHRMPCEFIPG